MSLSEVGGPLATDLANVLESRDSTVCRLWDNSRIAEDIISCSPLLILLDIKMIIIYRFILSSSC